MCSLDCEKFEAIPLSKLFVASVHTNSLAFLGVLLRHSTASGAISLFFSPIGFLGNLGIASVESSLPNILAIYVQGQEWVLGENPFEMCVHVL